MKPTTCEAMRAVVLMAALQERRRQAIISLYLCAASRESVVGALPIEMVWELERCIADVHRVK